MKTRTSLQHSVTGLLAAGAFFRGLRPFLRRGITVQEARTRLELQLKSRERTFSHVLHRAVFENPRSPYRRLFDWAGVSLADVIAMLSQRGLEATLERLHNAGIYLELEEFKGLQPVRRPGLDFSVRAEDFDNPLNVRQYEARTGGSGGSGRRVLIGLDLLDHECAYHALFYSAIGAHDSASAMWLPAPPGAVGVKNALIRAKLGRPIDRWFSQNRPTGAALRHRAFARATATLSNGRRPRIPLPEFAPLDDPEPVVTWLAQHCSRGRPAILLTTPSSAVRACGHALEHGRDISGSFFTIVGEPYTKAKKSVITDAECSAACHYAMVEAGMIGLACRDSIFPDDVHLVSDKIATIQRDRAIGGNGDIVPALFHTSLLPASPKVMLNVESGDYAVREERDCGCSVLPHAFRSHLHTIRSYEKLTSEGMHFLGTDLLSLLEQVLPARFGGYPTDYQLVEREQRGVPKVHLVVSPAVGDVDPEAIVLTTLEFLRHRGAGQHLMAEVWENGETLQVLRDEPRESPGGKILPLRKHD